MSLQIKKIALIRQLLKHDDKRSVIKSIKKRHVIRLTLKNFFDDEFAASKFLQRELKSSISFMHFSSNRRLYINLNVSKK